MAKELSTISRGQKKEYKKQVRRERREKNRKNKRWGKGKKTYSE